MSKIAKTFKAIKMLLKKPYLINHILEAEEGMKEELVKKYGFKEGLPTLDITEICGDEMLVEPIAFLDGSSLPTDFALLRGLAKKYKIEDYFEIGTWRGESVANLSDVVKNCTTLNLPDEEMRKQGLAEDYIAMHRFFSKDKTNVKHLFMDAAKINPNEMGKYDMIFIDGDHHYEAVKRDTQKILDLRKNKDAIIVWHDYAFSPEQLRWSVLRAILEALPQEMHQGLYYVSNTLCAVYLPDAYPKKYIRINTKPEKSFSVQIKVNMLNN